jgi:hypothetical protein
VGPERTLVVIEGLATTGAKVVWDVGLPSERYLPASSYDALFFSVPAGVSPGDHPVAIETVSGRSHPVNFRVAGVRTNSQPRVDDIMLIEANFQPDGTVRAVLYVQGPNVDVGADVLVDGSAKASQAHKVIIADLFGADEKILGYSIRHYLARIVPLEPYKVGSEIRIQFRNEAGELSSARNYKLPLDAASLDSDGDGIPDAVETGVFDNGSGTPLDMRVLGADPFRKDVFVEIDVMNGITHKPSPRLFELARTMFANAPVINPFGRNGINLVIDATGTVPHWNLIEFVTAHNTTTKTASFDVLRRENFTRSRWGLYHYAIWAEAHPEGYSGKSNIDFKGTGVGNGFFVTLSEFPLSYQTLKSQVATFVHELGHNLGQRHGGNNDSRYKPNYWSVMSYAWQLRTGHDDSFRIEKPTCTQIYYGRPGTTEPNGKLPNPVGIVLDYSEGMGPELSGNNGTLREDTGVCGQPIDWNRDGTISNQGVNAIVDQDDPTASVVTDFANWPNLKFSGPMIGGARP